MRNCGLLFSLGKIASMLLDRSRGFALPEGYGDGAQGSQSESGTRPGRLLRLGRSQRLQREDTHG